MVASRSASTTDGIVAVAVAVHVQVYDHDDAIRRRSRPTPCPAWCPSKAHRRTAPDL